MVASGHQRLVYEARIRAVGRFAGIERRGRRRGSQGRLRAGAGQRPPDPRGGRAPQGHAGSQAAGPVGTAASGFRLGQQGQGRHQCRRAVSPGNRTAHGLGQPRGAQLHFVQRFEARDRPLEPRPPPVGVFLGQLGRTEKGGQAGRAGRGRLQRGGAEPHRPCCRGLFQRPGRPGYRRSSGIGAPGDRPPARAGRETLRGRAHRHHRRPGGQGGTRQRGGRGHRIQARTGLDRGTAAGNHRREVHRAGKARRFAGAPDA